MKQYKILAPVDLRVKNWRELIRGFLDTNSQEIKWDLHIIDTSLPYVTPRIIKQTAEKLKAQAIIGLIRKSGYTELLNLNIPIVLNLRDTKNTSFSYIMSNNKAVGEKAADFFINQRYKHFAFVGFIGTDWSNNRKKGFIDRLKANHKNPNILDINDRQDFRKELLSFLRSLTYPVAIMACNDWCARMIADICIEEGISIPSEIAILGVDDDEFICTVSEPELSSIRLAIREQGRKLARKLIEQIETKKENNSYLNFTLLANVERITERGSTMQIDDNAKLISNIITFIDDNFRSIETVSDILKMFPISERNLEIRFKKETNGTTVYKYLIQKKIDNMKTLLLTTNMPIKDAALNSGFTDIYKVSRIFKRVEGVTPKEYRIGKVL